MNACNAMNFDRRLGASRADTSVKLNGNRIPQKPYLGPLVLMARRLAMMTSSNGIVFRVTGHLCGEFTGSW